jgi:hypothetical protein
MCAAIPRDASVVFVDSFKGGAADRFTEVVRGMCGVPAASMPPARYATVQQVVHGIEQAGRRPVLLASQSARLTRYGGRVRQVMRLRSTEDMDALTAPPMSTLPFDVTIWMSEPPP